MVPCKLGSSALGLMGEFLCCVLAPRTRLTSISDLIAHVRPEKGFHHLGISLFCGPDVLP